MAILNRFSANLLYCDSTHYVASHCGISWRFQARDSGNRAIRDSRFCAAKLHSLIHSLKPTLFQCHFSLLRFEPECTAVAAMRLQIQKYPHYCREFHDQL